MTWPIDTPMEAAPGSAVALAGEARRVIVPPEILAEAKADATPAGTKNSPNVETAADRPADDKPIDYAAEAIDVIEFANAMIVPLWPTLARVYTDEVRKRIAGAAAPLMAKYGVNLGMLGPELAFVITVAPLIVPTVQAIQHDRKNNAPAAVATVAPAAAAKQQSADAGSNAESGSPLDRFPGAAADTAKH